MQGVLQRVLQCICVAWVVGAVSMHGSDVKHSPFCLRVQGNVMPCVAVYLT